MAQRHPLGCAATVVLATCGVVLAAGCASAQPAPAAQHGPSRLASPASPSATLSQRAAATRYLAIADAGNRSLDAEFGRLDGRDRNRLAAAEADLRHIAATERLFDRRLLQIAFSPQVEQVARVLYRVNQARAWLSVQAASSRSLRQLHGSERQVKAANAAVEQEVKIIRRQLGLPPPSTS